MYNIEKFCNEANITVADMDADFWLALDRTTRVELVRCWWLDNDNKGYTSMTGASACAEFFSSKQNSIRGLQTEAFHGAIAPWQKGYESCWRAALAFLEQASIKPEQAQEAFDAVVDMALRTEPGADVQQVEQTVKAKLGPTWMVEDGVFKSRQGPECLIYACPTCGAGAYDHDTLVRGFGVRVNKTTGKTYPQTWCRSCKNAKSKVARSVKSQTKGEVAS